MGGLHPPRPVTPLAALIYGREELYAPTLAVLESLLGPCELESPVYAFDKTAYYEPEMGAGLKRRFVTFQRLADPAALASWKLATNALEMQLARTHGQAPDASEPLRRCINIDAGYLTGAKLVLASTKDFAHRIYLRDGIFAEITLSFRRGAWLAHDCTFPDFRAPDYHAFLRQARDAHLRKHGAEPES